MGGGEDWDEVSEDGDGKSKSENGDGCPALPCDWVFAEDFVGLYPTFPKLRVCIISIFGCYPSIEIFIRLGLIEKNDTSFSSGGWGIGAKFANHGIEHFTDARCQLAYLI